MTDLNFQFTITPPTYAPPEEPLEHATGYPIGVESSAAAQVCKTPLIAIKCSENLNKSVKDNAFQHLPNMFLRMAQDAEGQELPSATLVVPFHENNTAGVLPRQYVSELHLVIHRMPDDKELEESVPVPGQ